MTPTLVLLHGFLGGPWSYDRVIPNLIGNRRIVIPTLSYHGQTTGDGASARDFETESERLASNIRDTSPAPVDLVGYSLGGRLALAVAIAHPSWIRRLILLSARRGLDTLAEKTRRRADDEVWARLVETEGVDVFLERWWQQPIFSSLARVDSDILDAERDRRGHHAPLALAKALRGFGLGNQPSFAVEVRQLQIPTTIVAGSLDEKFIALSQQLANELPNGRAIMVEHSGHQLLVEAPDQVARIINEETTI